MRPIEGPECVNDVFPPEGRYSIAPLDVWRQVLGCHDVVLAINDIDGSRQGVIYIPEGESEAPVCPPLSGDRLYLRLKEAHIVV